MNQLTEMGLVGAWGAAVILDKALPIIFKYTINGKKNGNGASSADKPVEFWQKELRDSVKEVLQPVMEEQTRILHEIVETQQQQTVILTELVSVQRIRSGVVNGAAL